MAHLEDRELSALLDGALKGEALWAAQKHLEACDACRDAMAALSDQDAALGKSLSRDPGEAYFATFADRVIGRIVSAEAAGAEAGPADGSAKDVLRVPFVLPWWKRPRSLALAGTVTAVIAGAGIVLMTARHADRPLERLAKLSDSRTEQPAQVAKDEAPIEAKERAAAPATVPVAGRTEPGPPPAPATSAVSGNATPLAAPPPKAAPSPPPAREPAAVARREAGSTRMSRVPRSGSGEQRASPSRLPFATAPQAASGPPTQSDRLRQLKRAAIQPAAEKAAKLESNAPKGQELTRQASPAPSADAEARAGSAPDKTKNLESDLRRDADSRHVCGTVRDDAGRPLAGVSITAADAARTASTDADGRFCIELSPRTHTLQLMAVGFKSARLTVDAAAPATELSATLAPVAVLEENTVRGARSGDKAAGALAPSSQSSGAAFGLSSGGEALQPLPDSIRVAASEAARLQARAEGVSSAAAYETAALAWVKLLPRAGEGAAGVEVRARIAECRFGAWRQSRDASRSGRAIEALTAFIARAPAGYRRDLAARWLDQIRGR